MINNNKLNFETKIFNCSFESFKNGIGTNTFFLKTFMQLFINMFFKCKIYIYILEFIV